MGSEMLSFPKAAEGGQMKTHILRVGTVLFFLMSLIVPVSSASAKGALVFEEGFAPSQDVTVWQLEIAQGYPWVRGQVGDVKGVFMLDTGTPWGLLLNSARVRLPDLTPVVTGSAGSGQKMAIFQSTSAPPVMLQGQTWAQVRSVNSADLSFIEDGTGIGPYLGFIGANFFKGAELTLDYARRVAMVRRVHPDTGVPLAALPAGLVGGTVVAVVRYRGEQPNFSVFDATLDGTPVRVMLDSGNPAASLDQTWLAELRQADLARPFSLIGATTTYRTSPMLLGSLTVPVENVMPFETPVVLDGQTDRQVLKIGFPLLNRWGVTWNYRLKTMTFFAP
jgi:hypothetical protein